MNKQNSKVCTTTIEVLIYNRFIDLNFPLSPMLIYAYLTLKKIVKFHRGVLGFMEAVKPELNFTANI